MQPVPAAAERQRVNKAADELREHWEEEMSSLHAEVARAKTEQRILASANERQGAERAELAERLVSRPAPLLPRPPDYKLLFGCQLITCSMPADWPRSL